MDFSSVLVHLDNSAECFQRTRVAIRLARTLDCHLVGLAPTGLIDIPRGSESAAALADYAAMAWDVLRDHAEQATQHFLDECHAAKLRSFKAVIDEADASDSIVSHGHCSDLIVLSQASDGKSFETSTAIAEQVVLHSARPTLVVPRAAPIECIGQNILVAWDDTREAARALRDALPLLARAKRVMLVTWKESRAAQEAELLARLHAARQWLGRHGIQGEVSVEALTTNIARAIMSSAEDMDADLVVMGSYGHARWMEHVLGGATRDMLLKMSLPVLMSH